MDYEKITLEHVAHYPVGTGEDVESGEGYRNPETMPSVFNRYITELITQGDTGQTWVGHVPENSGSGAVLSTLNITESPEEFEESAERIAKDLTDEMDGNANEGELFVATASLKDLNLSTDIERVTALVKLDRTEDIRMIMRGNSPDEVIEPEAFPPYDEFDKGATYPIVPVQSFHPQDDVNVKIYQKSNSKYFREFLDGVTRPSSGRQGKEILDLTNELKKEELGETLSKDDRQNLNEKAAENGGTISKDVVLDFVSETIGKEVSEERLDAEFDGRDVAEHSLDLDNIHADASKLPENSTHHVYVGGEKITIKHDHALEPNVSVQETEDGVIVEIVGDDYEHYTSG